MLAPSYSSPRARYFDSNGNPLSGGRITYYYPDSTTLKAIYTDSSGQTEATNPHILDAEGYVRDGGLWFGEGNYKITLERSIGGGLYALEWTMDNVPSNVLGSEFLNQIFVSTIEDLRAIVDGAGGIVFVKGYYAIGDGGGGYFYWDETSSEADDGGSVIAPTGNPSQGRWLRIFGQDVNAWQFGAMGTAPDFVDAQLTRMASFADSDKRDKVVIPSDSYAVNTNFFIGGDFLLEVQEGAIFSGGGSVTLDPNSLDIKGQKALIADDGTQLTLNPNNAVDAYADWWGTDFAVNSEGKYPAKLKFNGLYSLAPSQASSHEWWMIEEGTTINFTNSGFVTTIKGYETDANNNNLFDGSYNLLKVSDQQRFSINHFANALTTGVNYEAVLSVVTDVATRKAELMWGGYKEYGAVPAFPVPTTNYRVKSRVLDGSLWAFDNACWVGEIVNDPRDLIFTQSSASYPIANNGVIYAQWLGAGFNVENDNILALERANLWGGGDVPVSGDNATFTIDEAHVFQTGNKRYRYNFKDMKLIFDIATPVSGDEVGFLNDVIIDNVDIQAGDPTTTIVLGDFGEELIIVRGKNSRFTSLAGLSTFGNIEYIGCDFAVSATPNMCEGIYINCEFTDLAGNVSASINKDPNFHFPTKIIDCVFNQPCWISFSVNDILITGNTFSSNDIAMIQFFGTAITNLKINNNTFVNTGVTPTIVPIGANPVGDYNNICVKENNFMNCQLKATEISYKQDILDTLRVDQFVVTLNDDWVIFAYDWYVPGNYASPYSASGSVNRFAGFGTDVDLYAFVMATGSFGLVFRRVYTGSNAIGSVGGAFASGTIKVNDHVNLEVV